MTSFSPTEAALEGFRVAKENPRAIAIWAVIQVVSSAIVLAAMISAGGPQLNTLFAMMRAPAQADPAQQLQMMSQLSHLGQALAPTYLLILPVVMLLDAVQSAAIMRVVLRPEQKSPGYLRLGADEFRILAVVVAKNLMLGAVSTVAIVVLSLVSAMLGMAGILIGVLGFFGIVAAFVYVVVRLSLSVPQSFAERRIAIFDSWRLTRGRTAPLLGCYLLATVLFIAVLIIGGLGTGAITEVAGMVTGHALGLDYSSLAVFFTPLEIVNLLLSSIVGALGVAIIGSPAAVIYKALSGQTQKDAF